MKLTESCPNSVGAGKDDKEDDMMNQFANRLAECRKKRNLTQAQVAENLSVSFQAVSLWERGETYPEIDKLVDIAELYQVSLDWLLNGTAANEIGFDNPVTDGILTPSICILTLKPMPPQRVFIKP